ncbi:MAG: ribonuclease III [Clostridia bacterium]
MDTNRANILRALQNRLQYVFSNIDILDRALTHTSYVKGDGKAKEHNERLEFLGDAVLELCVSEYLYQNYPTMDEGAMTRARSSAVCESALYQAATELSLGETLLLGRGESHAGGGRRPSILADALEAVLGAVFIDGGMDNVRALIARLTEDAISAAVSSVNIKDYKTMLQEFVQKEHLGRVVYVLKDESGPDHKKVFVMQAKLAHQTLGEGIGASKQEASQFAARKALQRLSVIS